jgi:hypothetical protein
MVIGATMLSVLSLGAGAQTIGTSLPVTLYGFVKGDLAFDTDPVDTGNFFKWVPAPDPANDTEDEIFLTANQTRLGLKFAGPEEDGIKTGAVVEVDFYGGGDENKANPMMRQAYVTAVWPDLGLEVLAGQTSDLISPLFPRTVNYAVQWWAGNIGYRRPQFRVSKGWGGLKTQVALARTLGGERKGTPNIQYRLAYDFKLLTDKPSSLGFSGHMATLDDTVTPESETQSINVEFSLPLTSKLSVKGEYWSGENMAPYLGCIGQAAAEGVGYWVDFGFAASPTLDFHVVYGVDDPDEESTDYPLVAPARQLNTALSVNAFWKLGKALTWANEVALLTTEYVGVGAEDGEATRFQTSFIFSF